MEHRQMTDGDWRLICVGTAQSSFDARHTGRPETRPPSQSLPPAYPYPLPLSCLLLHLIFYFGTLKLKYKSCAAFDNFLSSISVDERKSRGCRRQSSSKRHNKSSSSRGERGRQHSTRQGKARQGEARQLEAYRKGSM